MTASDAREPNDVYNIADDDELRLLIAEEAQLIWEEEELIAISKASLILSLICTGD